MLVVSIAAVLVAVLFNQASCADQSVPAYTCSPMPTYPFRKIPEHQIMRRIQSILFVILERTRFIQEHNGVKYVFILYTYYTKLYSQIGKTPNK